MQLSSASPSPKFLVGLNSLCKPRTTIIKLQIIDNPRMRREISGIIVISNVLNMFDLFKNLSKKLKNKTTATFLSEKLYAGLLNRIGESKNLIAVAHRHYVA